MIESNDFNEIYINLCKRLLKDGKSVSPRKMNTHEILDISFVLSDPHSSLLNLSSRNLSWSYAHGEFLWYLNGERKLKPIQFYSKKMKDFSDDGLTLLGAYGPKLKANIPKIVDLLKKDKFSRRAVIELFDNYLNLTDSKDIPCTLTLHFIVRNNQLHLFVNMRSNDFYLGLPYDVFSFTLIQLLVAKKLNIEVGNYHHHVDSLHYYNYDRQHMLNISLDHVKSRKKENDPINFLNNLGFMKYCERNMRNGNLVTLPYSIKNNKYCMKVISSWIRRQKES
ncbi:thymidylate synthase [Lactobacillus iners]|uniref:thymidylate synthase n=1 Tax=Lactobacillus iners TaxID=147802 RepID=UPI001F09EB3A|nr:thymidylate synthase [Lactobacillus iners]